MKMAESSPKRVENTVGKGEIAHWFPAMFPTLSKVTFDILATLCCICYEFRAVYYFVNPFTNHKNYRLVQTALADDK